MNWLGTKNHDCFDPMVNFEQGLTVCAYFRRTDAFVLDFFLDESCQRMSLTENVSQLK